MWRLLSAFLLLPFVISQSQVRNANCLFYVHPIFGYGCEVTNFEFSAGDELVVAGTHLAGRNDESVSFVEILNSTIEVVPQRFLITFPALERFHLQGVSISTLNRLRNCENLRVLLLSFNRIEIVSADTFADCINLEVLHLQNNVISNVERWAFRELDRLEVLLLNNNLLETINPDLFTPVPNLIDLGLSDNSLSTLNSRTFTPTPLLETLRLANNYFSVLNVNILTNLTHLTSLLLNGNQFDNFQANFFRHLPNLRLLNINDNSVSSYTSNENRFWPKLLFQLTLIRVLQFDQNPRLHSLSMSNNLIDELQPNTFVNNVNLESLDLGVNKLVRLPGTLLRANTRLVSLGLRRNGIEAIQSNFFANLVNLRFLNLQTNNCINRFFSITRPLSVDVTPYLDLCYRNFD